FFQAEDGIRDRTVTGVQTCALPICEKNITCWRCFPTPPVICIWDTCATTPSAMRWRATCGCAATTCFIPWGGTLSVCRRKMPPRSEERRVGKECRTRRAREHGRKDE